jgi:hypothetical protein
MGIKFWNKHLDRRISITGSGADYVSVKELLNAKLSEVGGGGGREKGACSKSSRIR